MAEERERECERECGEERELEREPGEERGRGVGRLIGLERRSGGRRRVYVPLVRRKKRFLEALEESGNVTLAREAAGLGKDRVYLARQEDAAFAAAWADALERFRVRAEDEAGLPEEAALEGDGLVLRRGRGGRLQVAARRPNGWSKAKEELFLARFLETGNIAAASRAAGFTSKTAWERRKQNPEFRRRIEEAREEVYDRLEMMLIAQGTELLGAAEGGAGAGDPQLAMWLLKRRDAAAAGTLRPGRAGLRSLPSAEDARASILRKVEAIQRHRDRKRLEEGWTQDPDGNWIPPGYGPLAPEKT